MLSMSIMRKNITDEWKSGLKITPVFGATEINTLTQPINNEYSDTRTYKINTLTQAHIKAFGTTTINHLSKKCSDLL